MTRLRLYLFALLLLATQWVVSAHAVEHLSSETNGKGVLHVCEICLAAYDLNQVLPSIPAALPQPPLAYAWVSTWAILSVDALPPTPSQRGPPRI